MNAAESKNADVQAFYKKCSQIKAGNFESINANDIIACMYINIENVDDYNHDALTRPEFVAKFDTELPTPNIFEENYNTMKPLRFGFTLVKYMVDNPHMFVKDGKLPDGFGSFIEHMYTFVQMGKGVDEDVAKIFKELLEKIPQKKSPTPKNRRGEISDYMIARAAPNVRFTKSENVSGVTGFELIGPAAVGGAGASGRPAGGSRKNRRSKSRRRRLLRRRSRKYRRN